MSNVRLIRESTSTTAGSTSTASNSDIRSGTGCRIRRLPTALSPPTSRTAMPCPAHTPPETLLSEARLICLTRSLRFPPRCSTAGPSTLPRLPSYTSASRRRFRCPFVCSGGSRSLLSPPTRRPMLPSASGAATSATGMCPPRAGPSPAAPTPSPSAQARVVCRQTRQLRFESPDC